MDNSDRYGSEAKPSKFILQWHITHKCNLRCAHCYQNDYVENSSFDDLIGVLDGYCDYLKLIGGYGYIYLTGGEPLVHPDFFRIIEEIKKREIAFSVLTNGTLGCVSQEICRNPESVFYQEYFVDCLQWLYLRYLIFFPFCGSGKFGILCFCRDKYHSFYHQVIYHNQIS